MSHYMILNERPDTADSHNWVCVWGGGGGGVGGGWGVGGEGRGLITESRNIILHFTDYKMLYCVFTIHGNSKITSAETI